MNVKQWLSRARNLDREIEILLKARDAEVEKVTSITQSLTGNVVQSTKDPHKFDRVAELEYELDRKIDELVSIKAEVAREIGKLSDTRYRTVLYERYIESKSFEQIAVDIHYTWRQTCRFHGRALIEMEGILNATK